MSEDAPTRDDPTSPPLDDLMLAMDVVDTLRHRRELVEDELDTDARDARFVERVKEIYESQGIEVPESVIREGVEALKQDRFVYRPPRRTLGVRLAEVYVNRGTWLRRFLAVFLLVLAVWGIVRWTHHRRDRHLVQTFRTRLETAGQQTRQAGTRLEALDRHVSAVHGSDLPPSVVELVGSAKRQLEEVRRQYAALEALDLPPAETYPRSPREHDAVLEQLTEGLAGVTGELGRVEQELHSVTRVLGLRHRIAGARALLPAETEAGAAEDWATLEAEAEGALLAGDATLAKQRVEALEALAAELAREYELRIVAEPGVQSGIWRIPADNPSARNHYIIVEAIDPDGRSVTLPVRNEETGRVEQVSRFGVRVPEEVFEAIKKDKLDNGIIDNGIFGVKRRGGREVEYRFRVSGGMITGWE